jgi:7-cyano-7-deazaguanine synthase in queuosine biosynthesis
MENTGKDVCIMFSGGSDSSLTAYRMSLEFDKVHLLTFRQFGQVGIENSQKSFAVLDEKLPGKFIHSMIDINDMFRRIYYRHYLRNLIKYRTLQLQFVCFACQTSFILNTIIYCKKNNIYDVRDGANTEYEEASPLQIPEVQVEIKKIYQEYGITHDSPVYDEHESFRSDHQLFELGLRPQANIKDDIVMYKAYQGYCRFMPGGVLFLRYWKRCKGFPEKVQMKMREHWLEEVDFMKSLINENI